MCCGFDHGQNVNSVSRAQNVFGVQCPIAWCLVVVALVVGKRL